MTHLALHRRKALGDVLLTLPLALELRAAGHTVSVRTDPRLQPLLDRCGALTRCPTGAVELDLQRPRSAVPGLGGGLGRPPLLDPLRRLLHRPTHLDGVHTLDRYRAAAGLPPGPLPILARGSLLDVEGDDGGRGEEVVRVGLVPTASHGARSVPAEALAFACAVVAARSGRPVTAVVLAGGAEPPTRAVVDHLRRVACVVDVDTRALSGGPVRLAELVAGCDLVVGADTGPLHLAQALDVPSLVLFGPTSVTRWGPWRASARAYTAGLACSPCSGHGQTPCRFGHRACLTGWSPSGLASALEGLEAAGPGSWVGGRARRVTIKFDTHSPS